MKHYSEFTQHQKILMIMCQANEKDWFLPADFMRPELGELFVGYEASARLSELAKDYPEMVDSQHEGKYLKRRLRLENLKTWLPLLSKDLRYVFHRAGLTANYKKNEQLTKGVAPGQVSMADMPPRLRRKLI